MREPAIELVQYQSRRVDALPQSVLGTLLGDRFRRYVEVRQAQDGVFELRGRQYVGTCTVGPLNVLIQPKIDVLSVFWMLGYSDPALSLEREVFEYGAEAGILDLLARLFANTTADLIHAGIYRAYVETTEDRRFVRGRIEPLLDERRHLGVRTGVVCRHAELTADVLHNQILRAATSALLQYRYRTPGITARLVWVLSHLAEVSPVTVDPRALESVQYGRLNAHYEPAIALARLVLMNLTFEHSAGSLGAPSFLLNMNAVFQRFVSAVVATAAGELGLRARWGRAYPLDVERSVPVDPDIVLLRAGKPVGVLDVKYKREDQRSDVYQALAYAKALNVDRAVLVYPEDGEVTPAAVRIRNDNVQILVRTIPVSRAGSGFRDLDRRAAASAAGIVREALDPAQQFRLSA